MSHLERVVVIGASLAGLSAAEAIRSTGWEGHLVVVDGESELPSDRPPLSKQLLAGTMEPAAAAQPLASRLDELDVDLRLGRRVEGFSVEDLRMKFDNDDELSADGVVIAAGSMPRRLAGTEAMGGVHVLRTLADSLALKADLDRGPTRVVVVGAGFIGAEVAATCRGLGLEVAMVEAMAAPLANVFGGGIVGRFVADLHRGHGVEVRLGVGVSSVEAAPGEGGRVERVTLTDGTRIPADVVVAGIGVVPEVAWLEGSGVTIANGVMCDETLLAAPGVVAAGDVANWMNPLFGERMRVEHWEHAIDQGAAAGHRLMVDDEGGQSPEPYAPVPWFWSDQYDRKVQMAGRPAVGDEEVLIDGSPDEGRFAVAFRRGDRCTGVLGVNRPRIVVSARMKMVESLAWGHVVGGVS